MTNINTFMQTDEQAKERRAKHRATLARRIAAGRIEGKILENGAIVTTAPKGYRPYPTRTLVNEIKRKMDLSEASGGRRICHINGKWQLQVRGKDLRRVMKAMPGLRQEGRALVQDKA